MARGVERIEKTVFEVAPNLAMGDGALGFWKALPQVFGTRVATLSQNGKSAISRPFGNFPLVDDYTYAETVFRLIKTGDFVLASNTNACAFAHIWLGVGVCQVLGQATSLSGWLL